MPLIWVIPRQLSSCDYLSMNERVRGAEVSLDSPSVPSNLGNGIDVLEPHPTSAYSTLHSLYPLLRCSQRRNHIFTEIARCGEFCHMSSGWFDCTEPTSSNLLEPHHHRDSKVWRVFSHEFGVVRLYRTFSSYIVTGETRCAGC